MSESWKPTQAPGMPAWQQHEVLMSESWKPEKSSTRPSAASFAKVLLTCRWWAT